MVYTGITTWGPERLREGFEDPGPWVRSLKRQGIKVAADDVRAEIVAVCHDRAESDDRIACEVLGYHAENLEYLARIVHDSHSAARARARRVLAERALSDVGVDVAADGVIVRSHKGAGSACGIKITRLSVAMHLAVCDALIYLGFGNVRPDYDTATDTATIIAHDWNIPLRFTCGHETRGGNAEEPLSAFCGLPKLHAGEHGDWQV